MRDPQAHLLHRILALEQAPNGLEDAELVGLAHVALLGELVQKLHGRLEGLAALEQLGLVGVVGEEDLAVGDVLVDFVLGEACRRVGRAADGVAEAEEVGDISGDHGNGEAKVSRLVMMGIFGELITYSLTMSI